MLARQRSSVVFPFHQMPRPRQAYALLVLGKSVLPAIKGAKVFAESIGAVEAGEQIVTLAPASIIGDRFIEALKIDGHPLLENLPGRIDRTQRRKSRSEEAFVEYGK